MADQVEPVLASCNSAVRELAVAALALIEKVVPDAVVEVDPSARLIAFSFQPGTYNGLVTAIALHKAHVNIMFSRGVELQKEDFGGLLEGTGKAARHIKVTEVERLSDPGVRSLIEASARITPRAA
ncbi:DUF1801 domain-containing protein [Nonomuraea polychroma]|uniref:DUF1801 domain-containing protein n=1 Tax=Nonomuraea polychroma TaxID=46176 RepID=UPI003D9294FE